MNHQRSRGRSLLAPLVAASTIIVASVPAPSAFAQEYPQRTVRIIVPSVPGSSPDTLARILAEKLTISLGQSVIVENKAGAGGAIGVQAVLTSPPDGHTLLYTSANVLTEIPYAMKPPFHPMKDVLGVALLTKYPYVLVVAADHPAKDLADLARGLKAAPDASSFASPSAGTVAHFGGEILNRKLGVNMQHVPYYGTPPALNAVMGKQVTMVLDSVVTSNALLKGGKLKALALAGTSRYAGLPQVPTFAEQGYTDFNDFVGWQGIAVSPKVPAPIVEKIYAVSKRIAEQAEFREQISRLGFEPMVPESAQQFSKRLQADYDQFGALNRTFMLKQ